MFASHKQYWNRENLRSLKLSIMLMVCALIFQGFAVHYVNHLAGTSVQDLLLDHLPVLDLDILIIQGALLLTLAGTLLAFAKPRYLNFTLQSFAIFIIVRSLLVSLTHLGADPRHLVLDQHTFGYPIYNVLFNATNDFFFSGHTGTPFLLALIFWEEKSWRNIFLTVAVLFGFGVLLAHVHYSIDVVAAPFITYSIFAIARRLFPRDYRASRGG